MTQATPPNEPADVKTPNPAQPPALPTQSRDDTDVGWGERPDPEDDTERLKRERPPHWG